MTRSLARAGMPVAVADVCPFHILDQGRVARTLVWLTCGSRSDQWVEYPRPMNVSRKRQMAELEAQRLELEKQARELEKQAAPLRESGAEGDKRSFLLSEARVLREEARELARKHADLGDQDRT